MLRNIIGAVVGSEIARKNHESGVKGAVLGTVAMSAMRRMGPLGLVLGGAWAAKKAYDRRKATRVG